MSPKRITWTVVAACALAPTIAGCASTPAPAGGDVRAETPTAEAPVPPPIIVEPDPAVRELLSAVKAAAIAGQEDAARLAAVCEATPADAACTSYSARKKAYQRYCADNALVTHVERIMESCYRGACPQVDDAHDVNSDDYALLVRRVPHALILFGSGSARLDKADRAALEAFTERVRTTYGKVLVVGRASRDGSWRRNLRLALERSQETWRYLVEDTGLPFESVGYITYGAPEMLLTAADARRITGDDISARRANRSALVFAFPCGTDPIGP